MEKETIIKEHTGFIIGHKQTQETKEEAHNVYKKHSKKIFGNFSPSATGVGNWNYIL